MEPIEHDLNPSTTRTSPPSPNTDKRDADPYWSVIERIAAGTYEATEPDIEEPDHICPKCLGVGWLSPAVPVTHPDFGKAYPCECMLPVLAARRLERLFGAAAIPERLQGLTFASYALTAGDQAARTRVEMWATEGAGSLLLYGRWGTGKTGLAIAAFRHRIETRQCDGLFKTSPDLLEAIRATFDRETGGPTSSQVTDAIKSVALLLIDDLGAEKLTDWVEERLYMVINHRYDRQLTTIYTSNLDLQALGKHLSQRIAWRVKEMSEGAIVHVQGANLRDR